jgi:hypothetical protein
LGGNHKRQDSKNIKVIAQISRSNISSHREMITENNIEGGELPNEKINPVAVIANKIAMQKQVSAAVIISEGDLAMKQTTANSNGQGKQNLIDKS